MVTVRRGQIWWADLGDPRGSSPASRRPVVVVQADSFNHSRIRTAIVVTMTRNLELARAPGNVMVRAEESGLTDDSVANVSQVVTLDRRDLDRLAGDVHFATMQAIDHGLRLVLDL